MLPPNTKPAWTALVNPRALKKHKERGPKRFKFTYEDIAKATGFPIWKVKRHVYAGKVDPSSLQSLMNYMLHYEIKKFEASFREKIAAYLEGQALAMVATDRKRGRMVYRVAQWLRRSRDKETA